MNDNIVKVDALSKSFADKRILDAISFSVSKGEFLVLLGVSGCGKTTLLRILSGLENSYEGTVKKIEGLTSSYIFQHLALLPWLTVFNNVAIGLRLKRLEKEKIEARVNEALDLVNMRQYGEYKPHHLSGGMKQRVALARALVMKPDILLMDEPFNSLDFAARKDMQEKTRTLCKTMGITAVLVTHDINEALSVADRVIVLSPAPSSILDHFVIDPNHDIDLCSIQNKIYALLQKNL